MFRKDRMRIGAKSRERGATMPELALGGVVFFTMLFSILEFSRALTAYNTLAEAVRRGARYASTQPATQMDAVKNLVVYGTTTVGTEPVAYGLTKNHVTVTYSNYGLATGTVKVGITGYQFKLTIPLFGTTYTMQPFWASARAESAGIIPGTI